MRQAAEEKTFRVLCMMKTAGGPEGSYRAGHMYRVPDHMPEEMAAVSYTHLRAHET